MLLPAFRISTWNKRRPEVCVSIAAAKLSDGMQQLENKFRANVNALGRACAARKFSEVLFEHG